MVCQDIYTADDKITYTEPPLDTADLLINQLYMVVSIWLAEEKNKR